MRKLILSADGRRLMARLLVDGALERLSAAPVERGDAPAAGDIYLARVTRPAPALDAAFVSLGAGGDGFLPDSEPAPGETLLVQVSRAAEGEKSPRLTLDVTLPGRLAILTPRSPGLTFSRRLKKPTAALAEAMAPFEACGVILRSAAADYPPAAVAACVERLRGRWAQIEAAAERAPVGRLRRGEDPLRRALIDWTWPPPETIAIDAPAGDGPYGFEALRRALLTEAPDFTNQVDRADSTWPEPEDLAALRTDEIPLPSGGRLFVEPTRALIAADVDSGARIGADSAAARLTANLEAPAALARRLRLLSLGGAVAIDFAGAPDGPDRRRIEAALRRAFQDEPVRLLGWAPGGIYMLNRRREGPPLDLSLLETA